MKRVVQHLQGFALAAAALLLAELLFGLGMAQAREFGRQQQFLLAFGQSLLTTTFVVACLGQAAMAFTLEVECIVTGRPLGGN